jgi:hypothetical protein
MTDRHLDFMVIVFSAMPITFSGARIIASWVILGCSRLFLLPIGRRGSLALENEPAAGTLPPGEADI